MNVFTINTAILALSEALDNGDNEAATEALEFLKSKSRFTADQRSEIVDLTTRAVNELEEEEEEEEEENLNTMAKKLRAAREHYELSVSASGSKSYHNGDTVAAFFEAQPAEVAMELADEFTPLPDGDTHANRYANLNIGSQRMNSGNKLRGAIRRGDIAIATNKAGEMVGFKVVSD